MNSKKAATIGILLLGMGLFGVNPASAKTSTNNLTESKTTISQSSAYTIAQYSEANSPLYGSWKLTYSIDGVVYESVLIMDGYKGGMGTTFYDPNLRRTRVILQTMYLKSSSKGLILVGYNPTDYDTKKPVRTYSPDNFLISLLPDGSLLVINCDSAGRCSDVDLQAIK
ncbi:hypothetical protein BV372_16480 [Nostoc sp. T09]|uniref:hypothetical protein n=1 Tax=Nostoc sp. T09 TaxID=1932621 RepID=UPI000A3857CF|nr:hypothetical protein [Nostoc sp. T09]OUL33446.1 hypothetical protein BV372_16480 [Nostoc sp. T09]